MGVSSFPANQYMAPGGSTGVSNFPTTVDTDRGAAGTSTIRTVPAQRSTAFTTGVTDISTTAQIIAAAAGRKYLRLTNNHATVTCWIGASGVTVGGTAGAGAGIALKALDSFEVPADLAALAWHGVAASGTTPIGYISGT